MKVEKAKIDDAQRIHELVNSFADKGEMLPRALSEIYENLRDFFVVRDKNSKLIGCVALHINWADLAEVKSLAVSEDKQAKGLGSVLIKACLDEAKALGIPTVFCLSYKPAFFEKYNFRRVDKMELPRKVWSECYSCPKFPDCDEVALIYNFEATMT
jgi:amino-acid N-acetyltransferase